MNNYHLGFIKNRAIPADVVAERLERTPVLFKSLCLPAFKSYEVSDPIWS